MTSSAISRFCDTYLCFLMKGNLRLIVELCVTSPDFYLPADHFVAFDILYWSSQGGNEAVSAALLLRGAARISEAGSAK